MNPSGQNFIIIIYFQSDSLDSLNDAISSTPLDGQSHRAKIEMDDIFYVRHIPPLFLFKCLVKLLESEVAFVTFLQCVFSNVYSKNLDQSMHHTVCIFSTVYFQMCPQSACIRRCLITLAALI